METKESKQVSNDTLLSDISWTEMEMVAYKELASGFSALAIIPENKESGKSHEYYFQSTKYKHLEEECEQFLNKLLAIKLERGL